MKAILMRVILFTGLICSGTVWSGINPNLTGAWYDTSRDGSGFLVEVLADDRAVVYWFTYDESGSQQWFIGVGTTDNNQIVVDDLLVASGGRFGPEFDPGAVTLRSVGTVTVKFDSCRNGEANYVVDGQVGQQVLTRLTEIRSLECDAEPAVAVLNQTASWYSADRAGEGFIVEVLDDSTAFVNWFTFDDFGNPAWFTGIGFVAEQSLVVENLLSTSGGRFGSEHDPDAVVRSPAGRLELYLGCDQGRVNYDMNDQPSGFHNLERLTSISGLPCAEDSYRTPSTMDIAGFWQSDGFGTAVAITADAIRVFQTTSSSCLLTVELPTSAALSLEVLSINQDNDKMQTTALDSVSPVIFDRVNALPDHCGGNGTGFTHAPGHNYDVFAATYDELYAAFEVREVDWTRQQQLHGPQVSAATSANGLFDVFASMLSPLMDRHTTVFSDDRGFGSGWSPAAEAYFRRAQGPEVNRIVANYLDSLRLRAAGGTIEYGVLEPGIGYLEIRSFVVTAGGETTGERLAYYRRELDRVFDYFDSQGVQDLVLDVRRNEGGDTNFGFELAGRFLHDATRTVYVEQRLSESGLTRPVVTQIAPSEGRGFDGNLVLLTGSITGSAAETFTLAIRALPHAILIGEKTAGVLSRTERILPNSWVVSLTVGQVRTPGGEYFEGIGIPPDFEVPVFTDSDYANLRDGALEMAQSILQAINH